MNLIERYEDAATLHLPMDNREEVRKAIHGKIEDMLPDNATEDDVRLVLEKLGNPTILADQLRHIKRYLIGPNLYYRYLSVLKSVITIIAIISAIGALVSGISKPPADSGLLFEITKDVFANIISAIIQGISMAFVWVTVIFMILERKGIREENLPFKQPKWSVSNLPVENGGKISRVETVFSMFFTILFTTILYFQPQVFGWYMANTGTLKLKESLFVLERLDSYMTFILLLAIVQLGILTCKFISKKWTLPLAIANSVYTIASCVLVASMFTDSRLFNQGFIANVGQLTNTSESQITSIWTTGLMIFAVLFIIVSIWESSKGFKKCKK